MEKIQELVLAAQKGDMDAFSWLYKETYDRNYYIVIKMVRQEQDAMDILQDTYVKVFQKLASFQYTGSKSFASWTSKIASNTALDFLRKKNLVLFSELQPEDGGDIPELEFEDESAMNQPELALDQKETARIVQELLDCLSEEQRICVILRYICQMKISEIALECGCPENTIKSRLNYAKKRLLGERETLEKKGIRLYNVAPFTLLVFLLGKESSAFQAPAASGLDAVMDQVSDGQGLSSLSSESIGKTAATKAGSAVSKWTAGKMAVVVLSSLALVGAGLGVLFYMQTQKRTSTVEVSGTSSAVSGDSNEESDVAAEAESTEEPELRSEEELYYEFINKELVPQYGLAEISTRGQMTIDYTKTDQPKGKANRWLKPEGLISAHISDLDQDGRKELFVVYWEKEKNQYDAHDMIGVLYEIEGQEVVMKDKITLSTDYEWQEIYCSVGNFSVIEMTSGEKKYLLFYVCDITAAFSDGYNTHAMWTMEYKDGSLQKVREVRTDTLGSDDYYFIYEGYTYENGEEKAKEVLYDIEDKNALYDTREEAFVGFFQEDGLDVSEIMEGMTALNPLTFTKTGNAGIIFTFNSMVMDSSSKGSKSTAYMAMEISDETNLRDHVVEK